LLLLCSPHHDVVDGDDRQFSVEVLRTMKARHEKQATDHRSLSTEQAKTFLAILKGSPAAQAVASINQSGGQIAHSITNFVQAGSVSPRDGDSKVDERRTAAIDDLWQNVLAAFDATLNATINLGPCEGDVHRQSYDCLSNVPFPEIKSDSDLAGWSSLQNDYLHVMAFPHFGQTANFAIAELARCGARARLFVSQNVLVAVSDLTRLMSESVAQAREAKTAVERWRHLFASVHRTEESVIAFEQL